jgi:hypothetical protein
VRLTARATLAGGELERAASVLREALG